jgi:hypothetical protein
MRDLHPSELQAVSGAGGCYTPPPPPCCDCSPSKPKKQKGNNGWGNGGNDPAPGNSAGKGRNGQSKTDDIYR